MTLLEVVTAFCQRTGIGAPATVMGSTDDQVIQVRALLEEACDDLASRGAWDDLINEATWTTTATENQGNITTLASNGYKYLLPETLWDRTERLPLLGPLDSQDWQALKAIVITGPRYSFRLRQGTFLVTPAPPVGHTWAFEYVSENWVLQADATTYRSTFAADSDTIRLPRIVVLAALRWRWKKEKGMSYSEDFDSAERLIADALGRDGGKPVLYLDNTGNMGIGPGIFVPSGTWLQP